MALAKQPSALPTNKLMVAAAIGPAATEIWSNGTAALTPDLVGPGLAAAASAMSGSAAATLVGLVVTLIVGWFVPDFENRSRQ